MLWNPAHPGSRYAIGAVYLQASCLGGCELFSRQRVVPARRLAGRSTATTIREPTTTLCLLYSSALLMLTAVVPMQTKSSSANSTHSRQHSSTSRQLAASSYGRSVGPDAQPPSTHGRAKTASFSKSVSGRPPPRTRPETSMGFYNAEEDADAAAAVAGREQQNGTVVNSFQVSTPSDDRFGRPKKPRDVRPPAPNIRSGPMARRSRQSSLAPAMGRLNINDCGLDDGDGEGNQAVSDKENRAPAHHSRQSGSVSGSIPARRPRRGGEQSKLPMAPPQTPARSTDPLQDALAGMGMAVDSLRTPRMPSMSPSPTKVHRASFLTKDSNTRSFTAWDVDERLNEVETQFKVMKEVVDGSLNERKALEQVIDFAKTRGTHGSGLISSLLLCTARGAS